MELQQDSPRDYTLTDEEIRKRNARREQNRKSAIKCRSKAKAREKALSKKLNKAASTIQGLWSELESLKKIKTNLMVTLTAHLKECTKASLVAEQIKSLALLNT